MLKVDSDLSKSPMSADEVASKKWGLVVGGVVCQAQEERMFANSSPFSGEILCQLPSAGPKDVDLAVIAGKKASKAWSLTSMGTRSAVLHRMADALRDHREELASLDALDVGNTYQSMLKDVDSAAESLEYMAAMGHSLTGRTSTRVPGRLSYTELEPYGVVARIVAFNHPLAFAAGRIGAPLIAGNAVILKPAESSPLSALRMGEIFSEILPKGLLSVLVSENAEMPKYLVAHKDVRRIGFVGSSNVGRAIQEHAARSGVKNVTLELGGKNAIIVCKDADLDAAAAGVVRGMNFTGWQSQSCGSTSRLLVDEEIADKLLKLIDVHLDQIRIGNPMDSATDMGTLASDAQYTRVSSMVEKALSEGASMRRGGPYTGSKEFSKALFYQPTVLESVTTEMEVANEEVFGPVLAVMPFRSVDEAISIANSVKYGLTASVFTENIHTANSIVRQLEVGYAWINDASTHVRGMPFGGRKESGVGSEESFDEVLSYTQSKSVLIKFNQPS